MDVQGKLGSVLEPTVGLSGEHRDCEVERKKYVCGKMAYSHAECILEKGAGEQALEKS